MRETAPYPGSSSLSPDARDKVLQTFLHTLELARSGRNEEALLGCDFILKMDLRFTPARGLLEALRGVSAGTVVDLAPFDALFSSKEVEPPEASPPPRPEPASTIASPAPDFFESAPSFEPLPPMATAAPPPEEAPAPAKPAGGSFLDSLGFDDFGTPPDFAPPPPGPTAPPEPAPAPVVDSLAPSPRTPPVTVVSARPAAAAPSFGPPDEDPFASFAPPQVTANEAPSSLSPSAGPSPASSPFDLTPPPAATGVPPAPAGVSPPTASSDPRVLQFLKQGDDAMSRGQLQEAIDLWSRVFLIDLSNQEAARRIDAAREKQAQTAQAIDVLLSEGIQLFDSHDLVSARSKFLDVLALLESEPTARNYLNQIDSALSQKDSLTSRFDSSPDILTASGVAAEAFPETLELEGHGAEAPSAEKGTSERGIDLPEAGRKIRLDVRVLIAAALVLVVTAGGGIWYFFLKPKPAAVEAPKAGVKAPPKAVGEDLIAKAQALFNAGKADEALQILVSIPDADPRHTEALGLIDRFKSSAVPAPASASPSSASLDELRAAGLAAMAQNRYIEAVRSLDPVVKARPEDAEATQALSRARDQLSALQSAVRAYNEQDYESAIKLLWELRRKDLKNQDVEEFLFKSYFNEGILELQAGNSRKAAQSFQEASQLRPADAEASRHLKFTRKYTQGPTDLLSKIYVRNAPFRP